MCLRSVQYRENTPGAGGWGAGGTGPPPFRPSRPTRPPRAWPPSPAARRTRPGKVAATSATPGRGRESRGQAAPCAQAPGAGRCPPVHAPPHGTGMMRRALGSSSRGTGTDGRRGAWWGTQEMGSKMLEAGKDKVTTSDSSAPTPGPSPSPSTPPGRSRPPPAVPTPTQARGGRGGTSSSPCLSPCSAPHWPGTEAGASPSSCPR